MRSKRGVVVFSEYDNSVTIDVGFGIPSPPSWAELATRCLISSLGLLKPVRAGMNVFLMVASTGSNVSEVNWLDLRA